MSEVTYLYGFLPAGTPPPPPEVSGIEDRPVEVIELEGFAAAVSSLPASTYGEEALDERVGDLRWMAHRGYLHERVVTWFVDRDGIVPVRFLTLHASPDSLREEARRRGTRIRELLARLHGRREWNLKVTFDAEVLMSRLGADAPEVHDLDRRIQDASPGRRYLLQRRRDDLARERVEAVAEHLAAELVADLGAFAEKVKHLPIARAEGKERIAAHAAFLVVREAETGFEARIEERRAALAERGVHLQFSGPWAPYRFIGETPPEAESGID